MIVENICEQSPRLNASQTSSYFFCLNKKINCNYEDLNYGDNQVDLITIEEEYFSDKNDYCATVESNTKDWLEASYANSEDTIDAIDANNDDDVQKKQEAELDSKCSAYVFNSKCIEPYMPKRETCSNINIVTPYSEPKEELKLSTLKVTSSHP